MLGTFEHFWFQITNINGYILATALATLLSGFISKHFWPKIPHLIVALLAGAMTSLGLNSYFGPEMTHITMVGVISQAQPQFSVPLFALTEAVSIGRAIGIRSDQMIDGIQGFIGQGPSNIAGSFFSGYAATGSFNRSSLNYQVGAKTPMSVMIAGFMEIVIVLAIAPLVAYLPNVAMAGILFIIAWGLIDILSIKQILLASNSEYAIFLLTFLGVLLLDLEIAILAGILQSLILYLMCASRPHIVSRALTCICRDVKFPKFQRKRPVGPTPYYSHRCLAFYGSVSYLMEKLARIERDHPEKKHLAVVAQEIGFVDLAAGEVLGMEAEKSQERGDDLHLIKVKRGLWHSLDEIGVLERIDPGHISQSKEADIHAIYQKLNKSICTTCSARVFVECHQAGAGEGASG